MKPSGARTNVTSQQVILPTEPTHCVVGSDVLVRCAGQMGACRGRYESEQKGGNDCELSSNIKVNTSDSHSLQ